MFNTSLCYLIRGDEVLLLHRTRKKEDLNQGKWIGIGGHFENGESPEECMLREFQEETGLTLTEWSYRGIVTFDQENAETEYMHLFTATKYTGTLRIDCDEGELAWVRWDVMDELPQWEGDRVFLKLLERQSAFFSVKLCYHGENLSQVYLNGTRTEI